jgi:hypothetical protein
MVATLLVACFAVSSEVDTLEIAIGFRSNTALIEGRTIQRSEPQKTTSSVPSADDYFFGPEDCSVIVDQRSGLVRHYRNYLHMKPFEGPVPRMTDRELMSYATRYAAAAGMSVPLKIDSIRDRPTSEYPCVSISFRSTISGLPVYTRFWPNMELRPDNRALITAYFYENPKPPDSFVSQTDARLAIDRFIEYLYSPARRHRNPIHRNPHPPVLRQRSGPELCVYLPEKNVLDDEDAFFPASTRAKVLNGQGILAWRLSYAVPNTAIPVMNLPESRVFNAFVDATTGKLLTFEEMWPLLGGGGGGRTLPPSRKVFMWDTGGDLATVTGSGRAASCKDAHISLVRTEKATGGTPTINLQIGRLLMRCGYDGAKGLLWTEESGVRSYGRPNESLRRALRQLLQPGG